jgi:glutamate carboxypeptidase
MTDPNALPLETETLLSGIRSWVETESPTFDVAAVNRMMDLATRDLAVMGARVERIPGRMGFGDCVRARFPQAALGGGADQPGILLLSHLDTVHPVGTGGAAGPLAFRREGSGAAERAYGPGICDMKGGAYVSLAAVGAILAAGAATKLPVTVLLTSDEEVGSPSTRDLIEAEAARHKVVLIPEPARTDGGVVWGRYAIARFALEAVGRPSHAGARLAEGRSAIREMAGQILAIEAMSGEDATTSVGVIQGGSWVNCVPTVCRAESLSMAKRQEDLDALVARMLALRPSGNDVRFTVTRTYTRPVWEPDAKVRALHAEAEAIARSIGLGALPASSAGGGSDGNFTGAMGIPTLDGLGVMGGGIHTLEEHVLVSSLVPRAKLIAGLLMALDG